MAGDCFVPMKRLGKMGNPESLHTSVEFLKTIKETLKEKKVVEDMEPLQTVKFAHHHNTVHSTPTRPATLIPSLLAAACAHYSPAVSVSAQQKGQPFCNTANSKSSL